MSFGNGVWEGGGWNTAIVGLCDQYMEILSKYCTCKEASSQERR